jgi:hypothetical protein
MVVFIDTSSLIKRYVEEAGSNEIDSYFLDGNIIYLAPTTPLEIRSALKRKLTEKSMETLNFQNALNAWLSEEDLFQYITFNMDLKKEAVDIIESYGVKTLDAIQIASAKLSGADEHLTSDRQMYRVMDSLLSGKSIFI